MKIITEVLSPRSAFERSVMAAPGLIITQCGDFDPMEFRVATGYSPTDAEIAAIDLEVSRLEFSESLLVDLV